MSNRDIRAELKSVGAVWYDLILPETKALPKVLNSGERILGAVYGRYKNDKNESVSRGVLVATSDHLILLNKKPMFQETDQISYRMVSGVNYSHVAFMGIVTLHTRVGDIHVRTFNNKAALNFVKAIEKIAVDEPLAVRL